jgi:hypothetical protein
LRDAPVEHLASVHWHAPLQFGLLEDTGLDVFDIPEALLPPKMFHQAVGY